MRLIVTADDLGANASVDAAIAQAAVDGIVTSVSVLTTGATVESALPAVDHLCLGLHLAFVDARPLSPPGRIPSLVTASGAFRSGAWNLALANVSPAELFVEAEAQYRRFVALVGRPPAFVNTHQHTQLLPNVLAVVRRLCRRYAISRIRCPAEQQPFRLGRRLRTVLWPVATASALMSRGQLARDGFRYPDRMLGGPESGSLGLDRLIALLNGLRYPVTELVVHPTLGSAELSALTHQSVADLLDEQNVARIRFDAL